MTNEYGKRVYFLIVFKSKEGDYYLTRNADQSKKYFVKSGDNKRIVKECAFCTVEAGLNRLRRRLYRISKEYADDRVYFELWADVGNGFDKSVYYPGYLGGKKKPLPDLQTLFFRSVDDLRRAWWG